MMSTKSKESFLGRHVVQFVQHISRHLAQVTVPLKYNFEFSQ